jgi:hypothetical protein
MRGVSMTVASRGAVLKHVRLLVAERGADGRTDA